MEGLFIKVNLYKLPNCPPMVKELWHIQTVDCYSAVEVGKLAAPTHMLGVNLRNIG
jgi:hypothetical protein